MVEVKKDSEHFFGRPYVGEDLDVKSVYTSFQSTGDKERVLELANRMSSENVTIEHVETALEYAENNPEEIEAIDQFDDKFDREVLGIGSGDEEKLEEGKKLMNDEEELSRAYREFIEENDPEYDFILD